ncbi:Uncharacterised protein [Mycobacteroides abscessus subsp. abscessus]|nr:Uncharacterised protein [Mycobacteroides abscessus subsp. abscessus]SIL29088.1 Uncharacterised protein [Mycobacteroides abscessus subsp. abscessus]SLG61850.1 Uncharacterised protein [Mycobacteroides abscessus subsp. abscessus]
MQALRRKAFGPAEPVTDHPQPPPGRDRRVLLPQAARGTVTRVRERRFAFLDERSVQRLEILQPEEHFTAHLQKRGYRIFLRLRKPFRHVLDGPGVQGDILTATPVPTSGPAYQHAVLVHQRERHTVDLQLAQVFRLLTDIATHPGIPGRQFIGTECVVQTQHSLQVIDRSEFGDKSRAADQLRRRIRCAQLGVLLFQRGQPP